MTETTRWWVLGCLALSVSRCTADIQVGTRGTRTNPEDPASDDDGSLRDASALGEDRNDSGTASPTDAAPNGDGSTLGSCVPTRCRGRSRACGDCIDNDGDGRSDAEDPDCIGPCDDSEISLAGGMGSCPMATCFFDPDCGAGNDDFCQMLVPNGCDCHGCCAIDETLSVYLGTEDENRSPTCTSSNLFDELACQPCEQNSDCLNECADCELCFGSTSTNDECTREESCLIPSCEDGQTPCGTECTEPCAAGFACITGCCVDVGSR